MENNGFYYCPRCSKRTAVWQSDFDSDECGYEEEGIVTFFTCSNCGSEIEVFTKEEADDRSSFDKFLDTHNVFIPEGLSHIRFLREMASESKESEEDVIEMCKFWYKATIKDDVIDKKAVKIADIKTTLRYYEDGKKPITDYLRGRLRGLELELEALEASHEE